MNTKDRIGDKDADRYLGGQLLLAMPTMTGAFAYDLYKSYGDLDLTQATSIGIGFVTSCIAGALVVRYLLAFVYGYLGEHDLMAVRTEAEKYLMMGALNLVECVAFVGVDKPRL